MPSTTSVITWCKLKAGMNIYNIPGRRTQKPIHEIDHIPPRKQSCHLYIVHRKSRSSYDKSTSSDQTVLAHEIMSVARRDDSNQCHHGHICFWVSLSKIKCPSPSVDTINAYASSNLMLWQSFLQSHGSASLAGLFVGPQHSKLGLCRDHRTSRARGFLGTRWSSRVVR